MAMPRNDITIEEVNACIAHVVKTVAKTKLINYTKQVVFKAMSDSIQMVTLAPDLYPDGPDYENS